MFVLWPAKYWLLLSILWLEFSILKEGEEGIYDSTCLSLRATVTAFQVMSSVSWYLSPCTATTLASLRISSTCTLHVRLLILSYPYLSLSRQCTFLRSLLCTKETTFLLPQLARKLPNSFCFQSPNYSHTLLHLDHIFSDKFAANINSPFLSCSHQCYDHVTFRFPVYSGNIS